ncbi:hypothetical protein Dimus_000722, partial [Dionaea muscipula]
MELQEKGSLKGMGHMDGASIWPDLQAEAVDIGNTSHQKYFERDLSDDLVEIDEDLFNKMMQEGEQICKEKIELGLGNKQIPDCSEPIPGASKWAICYQWEGSYDPGCLRSSTMVEK